MVAAAEILAHVAEATSRLEGVAQRTALEESADLSRRHRARVLLKREDRQPVRSFKLRGAFNRIAAIPDAERRRGVVCASAGNHAQGVAHACAALGIRAEIFMPTTTPFQKIDRVKHFGGELVEVRLIGESYDDASAAAHARCTQLGSVFVHPFDDPLTIAGQATVAVEVLDQLREPPDAVVVPIGGGGLIAGVATVLAARAPRTLVLGAEPAGAPAMVRSLERGQRVRLDEIDTFVDGAAVKEVGELTFELCRGRVSEIAVVPEGRVCTTMIELYQNEGVIAEPAGALSVAALGDLEEHFAGGTVVCILSGGNNDILRYPEIMERSLVHQGRKHYFIVEFAQRPGQLRKFVDDALGPNDDIVRFEYMKKTNKERGAALVGIELRDRSDLEPLLRRMREAQLNCRRLESDELLYDYLI